MNRIRFEIQKQMNRIRFEIQKQIGVSKNESQRDNWKIGVLKDSSKKVFYITLFLL